MYHHHLNERQSCGSELIVRNSRTVIVQKLLKISRHFFDNFTKVIDAGFATILPISASVLSEPIMFGPLLAAEYMKYIEN